METVLQGFRNASSPPPRTARPCASSAAVARIGTATACGSRRWRPAPTAASSATSRPSWWSPRAAARRWRRSKRRWRRTIKCWRSSRRISAQRRPSAAWLPAACQARAGRRWGQCAGDFVLGAVLMDGKGEVLHFGGQVMKNVAGYDVSRVMAGALGTLGLLLEVSVKVLPRPVAETTLRFHLYQTEAIRRLNQWAAAAADLGQRLGSRRAAAALVGRSRCGGGSQEEAGRRRLGCG